MDKHYMKLLPEYFDYIKNGTKRIEIRINDEKRQKLKLGDIIIFEKQSENKEYLNTKVKSLYKYNNINELIDNFDIALLLDKNITKKELINIFNDIYSKEKQDKYGILAIEIELI